MEDEIIGKVNDNKPTESRKLVMFEEVGNFVDKKEESLVSKAVQLQQEEELVVFDGMAKLEQMPVSKLDEDIIVMNPTGEQLKKIMDVVVEEAEHTELDLRIKRAKDYHGELWERKPITSPAIEHNQKFEFYDNLDFGKALDAMKRGHKVRRANWKYKQIYLLEGQIRYYLTEGDNDIVEYYNPYSDDILAEDWEILTEDIVAITK